MLRVRVGVVVALSTDYLHPKTPKTTPSHFKKT
jgi:hypothetical protein